MRVHSGFIILALLALVGTWLAVRTPRRSVSVPSVAPRVQPSEVPPDEIVSGGPPPDGIPPIDDPQFVSASAAASWLGDAEPGIAFSRGATHRFYPYQILVWHEIVNDTVAGERILVTYCPLCQSGYVLDPLIRGERVTFGTSGKLWRSNLVMYDRKTKSLWSQILGRAIAGELAGTQLDVLPSDQVRFGAWRALHPAGEVLSRSTGHRRDYGRNPYGDYFSVTDLALQLARPTDTRLPRDAFIFGLARGREAKAWSTASVKRRGEVADTFAEERFILRYEKDIDAVRMYRVLPGGREERVNPVSAFWFAWAAAHPGTALYP